MDTPKAEQIEAKVLEKLEGISTGAGFNLDYREASRKLRIPEEVNDFPVLFAPPAREPGELQVQENRRTLVQPVWGYANDEDDQASQLNKIRQDVETAIFTDEDGMRLGLPFVLTIHVYEVRKWQIADTFLELVRIEFHIDYTYEHGDP